MWVFFHVYVGYMWGPDYSLETCVESDIAIYHVMFSKNLNLVGKSGCFAKFGNMQHRNMPCLVWNQALPPGRRMAYGQQGVLFTHSIMQTPIKLRSTAYDV